MASSTNTVTSTSITTSVSSYSATSVTVTSKTNTVATSVSFTPTTTVTAASKANIVATSVSSTPTSAVTAGSKTNTVDTSVSFTTPTIAVAAASNAGKDGDSTPVSSLTDSNSKPTVITNLLEVSEVICNVPRVKARNTEIKEKRGGVLGWGGVGWGGDKLVQVLVHHLGTRN